MRKRYRKLIYFSLPFLDGFTEKYFSLQRENIMYGTKIPENNSLLSTSFGKIYYAEEISEGNFCLPFRKNIMNRSDTRKLIHFSVSFPDGYVEKYLSLQRENIMNGKDTGK